MIKIGESLGVRYHNNSNVTQIITKKKSAVGLMINDKIVNSQYINI